METRIDQEKWKAEVLGVFDKIKKHSAAYDVVYGDRAITVLPNVFSPKYFTDSLWFAEQLSEIVGDKSLLEIGTGTGIIALYCALAGARVVATDINPDATKNAKLNFEKYNLIIPVKQGDMYGPLDPDEKFDFIFWNHPFNNWDTPVEDTLLRAGLDYHYQDLSDYISGARQHLNDGGKLLLGTGNNADLDSIKELAEKSGYSLKLLKEGTMPLQPEGDVVNSYLIYELCEK